MPSDLAVVEHGTQTEVKLDFAEILEGVDDYALLHFCCTISTAMFFNRPKKPTSRLVPRRPTQRYRYVRLRWHLFFAAFDFVGGTIFGAAKLLGRVVNFCQPNRNQTQMPVRSILIIQLDHLGDAILSTGMIHVLRKNYPDARIDILVGPWNRALFEEAVEGIDRVLVFDGGGRLARMGTVRYLGKIAKLGWPLALLRCGMKLRHERYDLGIDVRGEMPHAALMWIARIRRRIGWAAGGGGFLLTDSPRWMPDRPEIENRQAILETIGIQTDPSAMFPRLVSGGVQAGLAACPRVCDTINAGASPAANCDEAANCGNDDKYIAIHLTAGTRAKEWPVEHWGRLISDLIHTHTPSTKIILVGSPADHIIGQSVEKLVASPARAANPARLQNLIGQLSLVELAAVLKKAELMIGADSGPAHMAAAVGTPTVVLFSGTNRSEQWRPPGKHVVIVDHDVPCRPCHQKQACPVEGHPCMTGITPQQVAKIVWKRTGGATAPG